MDTRAGGFVTQSAMVGKVSAEEMARAYADPLTQLAGRDDDSRWEGNFFSSDSKPDKKVSWILYPFFLLFRALIALLILAYIVLLFFCMICTCRI